MNLLKTLLQKVKFRVFCLNFVNFFIINKCLLNEFETIKSKLLQKTGVGEAHENSPFFSCKVRRRRVFAGGSLKLFFIILFFILFGCEKEVEDPLKDIDYLIENEKYEIAKEKVKSKLSSKRPNDTLLSEKTGGHKRIVDLSNDRNRIVWVQDKNIVFRDLANPLVKSLVFPQSAVGLSVSAEAEHALVLFPLPNSAGCRMVAVPLIENRNSYVSSSYVSCSNRAGITSDGTMIYYFIEDNLYMESTSEPKISRMIFDKKSFEYPYPNIKKKYYIYPIGKTFLILIGNAGSYILFWFDPKKSTVERIAEDVASPRIFYGNGKNLFFVSGTVGEVRFRELRFSYYGKPSLQPGLQINLSETNSWPMSTSDRFIAGHKGQLFIWGKEEPKKHIPILANHFWIVARDQIAYEDGEGKLVLTSNSFTEEDWKALDVYRMIKNKKEN